MGFYGNVANINKTNMTFDKIYPNRKTMDQNCASDGVYSGRYVLVEYQRYYSTDTQGILYQVDNKLSLTYKYDENFIINTQNATLLEEGKIYRCVHLVSWINSDLTKEQETQLIQQYFSDSFFKVVKDSSQNLILQNITNEQDTSKYIVNFLVDKDMYGSGKGYDSTVWMKTYTDEGAPKYVNIAELNSVIPTFDITVEAPTEIPTIPHFGEDTSNIYYNLHLQPSWGFRVKEAQPEKPSDAKTQHTLVKYENGKEESYKSPDLNADIYFNKAGFNPEIACKVKDEQNYISITTDDKSCSGRKYNGHDGKSATVQPDTKELSIHLPAIGNMMSDAWDIIYGKNRKSDAADSLQGCLNFFTKTLKNNEIPVQSEDKGLVGATTAGDTWITPTVSSDDKKITIEHKTYFNEASTTPLTANNSQQPDFGGTFSIPYLTIDAAGHISNIQSNIVKIPEGSYTSTPSNKALTEIIAEIEFTPTTGAISSTKITSNTFQLSGYTNDNDAKIKIQNGDSINTAFAILENTKMDKVEGKGLSSNDFTNALLEKLNGIAAGAEVNVQSDWKETDESSDAFIWNKPELGELAFKNTLTANDVGALPKDTPIPSIEGLVKEDVFEEKIKELTQIISQLQERIAALEGSPSEPEEI